MSAKERVRQLVDGELSPEAAAALRSEAEHDPELRRLLDDAFVLEAHFDAARADPAIEPPADLATRAMRRAVAARDADDSAHGLERLWIDVSRPRLVRVRVTPLRLAGPLVALAVAAALVVVYLAKRSDADDAIASVTTARGDVATAAPETARARVPVRFVLPAGEATSVAVAGEFNGWDPTAAVLTDDDGDGVFVGTLDLPPGNYAYMFVVDGERWVTDPNASNYRDDGFGNRNAVLRLD